jgi:hypothetical protein
MSEDQQYILPTPLTDAVCAEIDLDQDGYPKQTYEALCKLSLACRKLERELGRTREMLKAVVSSCSNIPISYGQATHSVSVASEFLKETTPPDENNHQVQS